MKKTQSRRKTSTRATAEAERPIDLLKEDHKKVKQLFQEFEDSEDSAEKEEIVRTCIRELKIHTKLEEEIFYPAARQKIGDKEEGEELLNEAKEEHHVVDLIIEELEGMSAEDEGFDAKFTVLSENVKHHIKEEEGEMFPKLQKTEVNNEDVAARLTERKEELQQEIEE